MTSRAFVQALSAAGFVSATGQASPGLTDRASDLQNRFRNVLADDRVGLNADAVFSAQSVPAAIFKDAGTIEPTGAQVASWHEAAWNIGFAPLLWVVTPTEVKLFDCYSPPETGVTAPLEVFALSSEDEMRLLVEMCGRTATETGAFWASRVGERIDRKRRVDRVLLEELSALEEAMANVELPVARDMNAARDFAQRLIGRCIFTAYLIDRGIAQEFLPRNLRGSLPELISSVDRAVQLFEWLRSTFNGDLFPMKDPGAERAMLTGAHLAFLGDFFSGVSLVSGQHRFFRFRFDAIPVDLISSIYQQFARSSAVEQAHEQGLHYTPIEVVHLALDPVFEGLNGDARVIDPTCGSGAFLVEAFRRLVWKRCQGGRASREIVRDTLYNQLFGIDINESALGIAAFSLYLAAIELDGEPVRDVAELKFDRLIGSSLFRADALDEPLPSGIGEREFDAVVGNPPWTFVHSNPKLVTGRARPRRSPDQAFVWVASRLVRPQGRVGMILKASPFFSIDKAAIDARDELFSALKPVSIVNLSALRKEGLFPDASGPALLFFARCSLGASEGRLMVGSVPWSADFRRSGVFHIAPSNVMSIGHTRVSRVPALLKAAAFGSPRDVQLLEKLHLNFQTLEEVLERAEISSRGQGVQVGGGGKLSVPSILRKLPYLTADGYSPFRIEADELGAIPHKYLHRTRDVKIFEGPLLVCPKGAFTSVAQAGRYSAAYHTASLLFNESFYGISFPKGKARIGRALCAILNSSIASFQLAFGGAGWGLERPTVEPKDLLALRIPDLLALSKDGLDRLVDAETTAAKHPDSVAALYELDKAVFDAYDLDEEERVLANESANRAAMLLFESRKSRCKYVARPSEAEMVAYAEEVVRSVNKFLSARGERHMRALVPNLDSGKRLNRNAFESALAVRFEIVPGATTSAHVLVESERDVLGIWKSALEPTNSLPYLNERREVRIYDRQGVIFLKPAERRCWDRASGLNDADRLLADHWISNATTL